MDTDGKYTFYILFYFFKRLTCTLSPLGDFNYIDGLLVGCQSKSVITNNSVTSNIALCGYMMYNVCYNYKGRNRMVY